MYIALLYKSSDSQTGRQTDGQGNIDADRFNLNLNKQ